MQASDIRQCVNASEGQRKAAEFYMVKVHFCIKMDDAFCFQRSLNGVILRGIDLLFRTNILMCYGSQSPAVFRSWTADHSAEWCLCREESFCVKSQLVWVWAGFVTSWSDMWPAVWKLDTDWNFSYRAVKLLKLKTFAHVLDFSLRQKKWNRCKLFLKVFLCLETCPEGKK